MVFVLRFEPSIQRNARALNPILFWTYSEMDSYGILFCLVHQQFASTPFAYLLLRISANISVNDDG